MSVNAKLTKNQLQKIRTVREAEPGVAGGITAFCEMWRQLCPEWDAADPKSVTPGDYVMTREQATEVIRIMQDGVKPHSERLGLTMLWMNSGPSSIDS